MLKDLLKQRSNSPPSPSNTLLDQIIKGHSIALHNTTLLAYEIASLRRANEKKRQKRTRSHRQMAHEGGLTIADGLQLAQQPEQPVEVSQVVSHEAGESATQADLPRQRAPPRCSGCWEIGHKINRCNKR